MLESKKLLKIDLSNSRVTKERIPDRVLKSFLGGKGINIYYLLNYANGITYTLGENNPLIFSNGILTGSPALSSSRIHISAVSPLTGMIGSSNAGGFFGKELSDCGILSVIITGRSSTPVYVYIEGSKVEIRDASLLWGLDTREAWQLLMKQTKVSDLQVAVIGPAGENLVKFASVVFPPNDAAGRTGIGAVMGSKNLKAIAVKSVKTDSFKVNLEIKKLIKEELEIIRQSKDPNLYRYAKYGDSTYVKWLNDLEAGSFYNFRDIASDKIDTADGLYLKNYKTNIKSCFNCPIRCRAEIEINLNGEKFNGERPDFEPMILLGPRIGNFNAAQTVYLHTLCNRYGLDSIDTGAIIGFLMDIYDRGIISKDELGGIDLKWGDVKDAAELIKQIALRNTKIGDILGNGLREASKVINRGAEKFAYHVKGLSMPAMDPRGFKASALGYAVSNRGADFTSVYARQEYSISKEEAKRLYGTEKAADRLSEEAKPQMLKNSLVASAVLDSLGLCKITYLSFMNDYELKEQYKITKAITGWDGFKKIGLYEIGEKIITLERIFNIKRGASAKDDYLPEKFINEPVHKGISRGSVVRLESMRLEFYKLMGWDKNGFPKKETIERLKLNNDVKLLTV